MARPLRFEYPGALWHVHNRGVEKRNLFHDDLDRSRFVSLVGRTVLKCGWRLFAYVLMSNHYHLLLETPEPNLSIGMKEIDGSSALAFNRRYGRVGHLFAARFKAHLVDTETYLLDVCRYIVLNPVRAGMVSDPADWRWSSYRATAALASVPQWLDAGAVLDRFDRDDWTAAAMSYRDFVRTGIEHPFNPWERLVDRRFLGSVEFVARMREMAERSTHGANRVVSLGSIRDVLMACGVTATWPPGPGTDGRTLFGLLASRLTEATRSAIGSELGITGQAAGRLITAAERRVRHEPAFAARLHEIEEKIQ